MTTVLVERLSFAFEAQWLAALAWDAPGSPYRHGIECVKGKLDDRDESTKAMDVVAVRPDGLWLIEVKDFRPRVASAGLEPNAVAYDGRWKSLPLEVALKARDTLAGVAGVVSLREPDALAAAFAGVAGKPVRVVACIAQGPPRPSEPESKRSARAGEMRKNLQRKLAWLTRQVSLIDPLRAPARELPDVVVTSRPDDA